MTYASQFSGAGIKQILRGTIWVSPGQYNANYNIGGTVVMANTELRYLSGTAIGSNGTGNNVYPGAYMGYIMLYAVDTIQVYRFGDGGGAWTLAWELTEFYR